MDNSINLKVYNIIKDGDKEKIDAFIEQYLPFTIKVASEVKNGYIDAHNDEEFSIAMLAFHEAMSKYEYDKGHFLSFARLVIASRLKTYWKKEAKHEHDLLDQSNQAETKEDQYELVSEIKLFEEELLKFGISFENLVENSPKHEDTRIRAAEIGKKTSSDDEIMYLMYEKKRLPITLISRKFKFSIKIIKHSKIFITATALIFYNKFVLIGQWIHKKDPKFM